MVENAAIFYVDADSGGPIQDGSSWCSAFTTLQHALGVAVSGDIILVAEGTYMPDGGYKPMGGTHVAGSGVRTATFQLKTGVQLIGGYAGCGQLDPGERDIAVHATILSGDLNANDGPFFQNNTENSLHVVTGSGVSRSALIDGFTIRDGLASAPDLPNGLNGGGVLCDGGSPTIANCLITHNTAGGGEGGGMRFYRGSDALITKCTIDTNAATGIGCLLSSPVFTDCTITWNYRSGISAWACNLTAVNCEISHNTYSGGFGGGVRFGSQGRSILSGCKISGNSAERGGGIYAGSLTDVAVSSCIITGNSASYSGGGVASYEGDLTVINSTFTANAAPSGGALQCSAARVAIHNSILWSNTQQEVVTGCELTVGYSDVQGGLTGVSGGGHLIWLDGNVNVDPQFGSSYHLSSHSPCIDAGDPVSLPPQGTLDFDGEPRIANDRVDMGADEYHDCNSNGVVDYQEIADGVISDCTANHVPDECEPDCNGNATADSCDISSGSSKDCAYDGFPDECESDCNENGMADSCDIAAGSAEDCNANGVPDECIGLETDCNLNGIPDECDTVSGSSDCNKNRVPDECEDTTTDCNGNGVWDPCELQEQNTDRDLDGVLDTCEQLLRLYVDDDAPHDAGRGDPQISDPNEDGSPLHPFDALQEAIDAAISAEGLNSANPLFVEIVVMDGIYTGTGNRDISLRGRPYLIRSANGPTNCILDCQQQSRGFTFDSGEGPGTRLEGLAIVNGFADFGGGIACSNSHPTVTGCRLASNSAVYGGGAVYCESGSIASFIDCTMTENTALAGGAFYTDHSSPVITKCSVTANTSTDFQGGAIACSSRGRPIISSSLIAGNTADSVGGGISCSGGCDATINDCVIKGNSAGHLGGGIYYSESHPRISRCAVTENTAAVAGGGIQCAQSFSAIISDSLVAGNTALNNYSGGIDLSACYDVNIRNCTVVHNTGVSAGGIGAYAGSFSLTGSIVWDNSMPNLGGRNGVEIAASYNLIEGGASAIGGSKILIWGEGNLEADPRFRDPDGSDGIPGNSDDDFRLFSDSPCVNGADPEFIPKSGQTDLDGYARRICASVDMGAYEFGPGDTDCDRCVEPDEDYVGWSQCLSGPSTSVQIGLVCASFDLDADSDADLMDFRVFQREVADCP